MHSIDNGQVSVVHAALHFLPCLLRLIKKKLGAYGCDPALVQTELSVLRHGAEQHIMGKAVIICRCLQVFAEFRELVHACLFGQLRSLYQHTVHSLIGIAV